MNIIKQLEWRYATKSFDTTKKVSDEKLLLLKQAFNLTPTAYGLQPIRLVIVENQKIREKLLPFAFDQKKVVAASHLLVICIEQPFGEAQVRAYFQRVQQIRNTPDEILNPFKENVLDVFGNKLSSEQIQNASTKQAYIALGNLLAVCAAEQIDACPMEGFMPEKFDEVLALEKHNLHAVLLLPIGYRSADDFMAKLKKVRKPLEDSCLHIT